MDNNLDLFREVEKIADGKELRQNCQFAALIKRIVDLLSKSQQPSTNSTS